ncbi:MAG: glycosyltransferase family 2 protein [Candidatus Portnoybacteria bacterium]|nr:glycosyltransferase family 2 protein [Candidatus Portnoybacteria bacterium]
MRISILIPCHNEERSIERCVKSCLEQTRKPDEIIVVNDGSTDKTAQILAGFGDQIKVANIEKATGNKSYAQEFGLQFITGDIFIATDGDTFLDKDFVKTIEEDFLAEPKLAAVGGYVRSLKYNWLTACREMDYILGQDLYKVAQASIDFLFVIPGCAGAFKTDIFRQYIKFDHDTLTEDLDFTYKLHLNYFKIKYNKKAICYTQDPFTLGAYINQMRRWFGGGWQNLIKNFRIANRPANALELSLMYIEGLIFSSCLFIFPLVNILFFERFMSAYCVFVLMLGLYCSIKRKRIDLLLFSPLYLVLVFINSWVFLEQFVKEVVLGRKNLDWFKPERFKNEEMNLAQKI